MGWVAFIHLSAPDARRRNAENHRRARCDYSAALVTSYERSKDFKNLNQIYCPEGLYFPISGKWNRIYPRYPSSPTTSNSAGGNPLDLKPPYSIAARTARIALV